MVSDHDLLALLLLSCGGPETSWWGEYLDEELIILSWDSWEEMRARKEEAQLL